MCRWHEHISPVPALSGFSSADASEAVGLLHRVQFSFFDEIANTIATRCWCVLVKGSIFCRIFKVCLVMKASSTILLE